MSEEQFEALKEWLKARENMALFPTDCAASLNEMEAEDDFREAFGLPRIRKSYAHPR